MVKSKNFLIYTALLTCMTAASSSVLAQQQSADGEFSYRFEEIVVTAQKREESLQDIPKQVQVVNIGQMENNNVTDIQSLVKLVPSMNGYNGLGMGGKTSMRGVGTAAPNIGAESKVGITVDGVPIPSRATGLRVLNDIQQVEVLPGPQGTLAGRNATGGLINLVTRRPSLDAFSANFNAKFTDDHEEGYGAFLTGPINDTLAYSFSASHQYLRGLAYNIARDEWDTAKDVTTLRGKLLWAPNDQTDVIFTYQNSSWEISGGGSSAFGKVMSRLDIPRDELYSALEVVPGVDGAPTDGSVVPTGDIGSGSITGKQTFDDLYPGLYDLIQELGSENIYFSSPNRAIEDRKTDFATLTFERDVANGTFTVIGSILDEKFPRLQNWADYSLENLNIRPDFDGFAHIINYAKQNTLEARYVSDADQAFSYIAGVYWSDGENRYDYERLYLPFSADRRFGTTSKAVFGSASYALESGTTFRAGLRYEEDDIDYLWHYRVIEETTKTTANGVEILFPEVSYPGNGTDDNFSDSYVNYDLGVQHHFNDDLMVYLNYASANQGPIYDAEFIQGSQDGTPLEPLPAEEVTSIETGVKSTLLDGRMTLNLNFFDMDFTNYQAITNVTDPNNPTSQPILKTYAAGAVKSQGMELTMQTYFTDSFRLDLAGLYNIAEIADWANAPCYSGQTTGCVNGIPPGEAAVRDYQPNIAGNRLADAAKVRYTAIGTYSGDMDLFGGMGYDFSVTVSHTGDTIGDQLGDPETARPARTDVDANLSFTRGPVQVSIFGVNLTESGEETFRTGLRGALKTADGNSYPREAAVQRNLTRDTNRYLGLRLRYSFE